MNAKKTLPRRELTLVLDGHAYEVSAEGDAITVNGRRYTVEVESDTLVFVDGIAYQIEWEGEQAHRGPAAPGGTDARHRRIVHRWRSPDSSCPSGNCCVGAAAGGQRDRCGRHAG